MDMPNELSKEAIINNLKTKANIITVSCTDSTNTHLKALAEKGASEWTVLCANKQTKGKGRTGNSFYSPENGIYMSILLRPVLNPGDSLFITSLAACSTCSAIEKLTDKHPKIKWVNDIYTEKGKICGILTESSVNYKDNKINFIVLGIGINLLPPKDGFPDELAGKAASLYSDMEKIPDVKNKLIAEIINEFYFSYIDFDRKKHACDYKSRSFLINKDIEYLSGGKVYSGKAIDIDEDCRLIIQDDNGNIKKLVSGEVKLTKW